MMVMMVMTVVDVDVGKLGETLMTPFYVFFQFDGMISMLLL
jgi:hypothetical protein